MALKELKDRASREMSGSHTEDQSLNASDDEDDDKSVDQNGDVENDKSSHTANPSANPSPASKTGCRLRTDHRKEKSLGLLTQNFVKLFLTIEADTVSLDEAARLLLGDGHDSTNMRTKVRRLYDIANVLSSLNLIEKTQQLDTRKPAFRWLGAAGKPKEENCVTVAVAQAPITKPSTNKRTFGADLTNVDIKRSRLSSSGDQKFRMLEDKDAALKECNLAAEKQLGQGNKGGFVFGPFQPAGTRKPEVDDGGVQGRERVQDWESLAASFRPQYQNQALKDLFAHYVEAWKSWYLEFAHGSSTMQQQFGNSVIGKFL